MRIPNLFKRAVDKAENIVITTHVYPDADGIGSQTALCLALRAYGKNAQCVNEKGLLERYQYLDPESVIISYDQFKKRENSSIDLFIVADTNTPLRIGENMQKEFSRASNILFIDHHPCSKAVEIMHCVDINKAATGQLVGELIEFLGIPFSKSMALSLYTAILIDTNSFRYPSVTAETHRLIGKLCETGVSSTLAYNKIYGTKKVSHMQLLGHILSAVKTTDNNQIGWIVVRQEMIDKFDSNVEDTHAFINHLLILENIKVACMFRDIGKRVKISFRSAGDIDVGVIATAFGGGGHNHSAATVVEGKLDKVIPETISKLETILKLI